MRFIIQISVLLMFIQLTGCKSVNSYQAPLKDDLKVLVVSNMGDEFNVYQSGGGIYPTQKKQIHIQDWELDRFIELVVVSMGAETRHNFFIDKNLPYRNHLPIFMGIYASTRIDMKSMKSTIFDYAMKNGYEAILIINGFRTIYGPLDINDSTEGIGFYKRFAVNYKGGIYHVNLMTSLYDVATREQISSQQDLITIENHDFVYPLGIEQITPETIAPQKKAIKSLIQATLIEQMKRLKLVFNWASA